MTSRKLSVLVVASALSMAAGAALAQQQGNADAGKQKSSMCAGCHGIPGYRTAFPEVYTVPKIGGQHASYIVKALQGYKSGDRKHHPWIDLQEAEHEYGLKCLAQAPAAGQYSAIVLAVGHKQFIELGEAGIKAWGRPDAVFYDVKSILPLGAADARL